MGDMNRKNQVFSTCRAFMPFSPRINDKPHSIRVYPQCVRGLHGGGGQTLIDRGRKAEGSRALPPPERTDGGCALPSFPHSNMAKLFDIITQPASPSSSSPSSSSPIPPSLSPPPPSSPSPSSPVPWWPGRMEKLSASLSEITWSPLALPLDAVVSKFRLPTLVRLAHGRTRTFFARYPDLQLDPSNFSHAEDVAFVNRLLNRFALCHHSCVNQTSTSTYKMP